MSHIRCLTNPEALYIFDSASLAGMTEITHRIDPPFASPWRKRKLLSRMLAKRWESRYAPLSRMLAKRWESRYAIKFSYGRHWFLMWRVTWHYIASSAAEEET